MLSKVKVFDAMGRYLRVLTDEGIQAKLDFEMDLQRMGELLNKMDSIAKGNSAESNSIIDTVRNLLGRTSRFDSMDHFIFFLEKLQPVIQALPSPFATGDLITYIRQSKQKWEQCKASMSNAELISLRYSIVENLKTHLAHTTSQSEVMQLGLRLSNVLKAVSSLIMPERKLAHQQLIDKVDGLNQATELAAQLNTYIPDLLREAAEPAASHEFNALPDEKSENEICIHNAGLALIAPFIKTLFEESGYVINGRFVDDANQRKCLAVLQFIAAPLAPCYACNLPLGKLLCGMSLATEIDAAVALSAIEKSETEYMLSEITKSVDIFNNISVDDFRHAFINRKGTLAQYGNHTLLKVTREKFDVILDKVPWRYQVIRFPWMALPLVVEW